VATPCSEARGEVCSEWQLLLTGVVLQCLCFGYKHVCHELLINLLTCLLIRQTEKARHLLAVREKLRELRHLSKPVKDQNNEMKRRCSKDDDDDVDCDDVRVTSDSSSLMTSDSSSPVTSDSSSAVTLSSDRQQQLVVKCVKLLTQKHFLEVASNAQVRVTIAALGLP